MELVDLVLDWKDFIMDIAWPIAIIIYFFIEYYRYKTGERKSIFITRKWAIILIMTFILFSPIVIMMKDFSREILIVVLLGGFSVMVLFYLIYHLPGMLKYFFLKRKERSTE
ncbi:hypothetical protein [Membranihabitans maritimus]|uniref:hypothetical protein n=1 Tax=Membranihabitans maritimus TaxID=2904244 RepID=UPI001F3CD0DD|nr:hypothetical protein [Membranihabitans maritimus]